MHSPHPLPSQSKPKPKPKPKPNTRPRSFQTLALISVGCLELCALHVHSLHPIFCSPLRARTRRLAHQQQQQQQQQPSTQATVSVKREDAMAVVGDVPVAAMAAAPLGDSQAVPAGVVGGRKDAGAAVFARLQQLKALKQQQANGGGAGVSMSSSSSSSGALVVYSLFFFCFVFFFAFFFSCFFSCKVSSLFI
jgi:hypothetical protein